MEKANVDGVDEDPQVRVRLPRRSPVLYPQAARVLRRIVLRLARSKPRSGGDSRREERAS